MNRIRIVIEQDNTLTASVLGECNEVLEEFYLEDTYTKFFNKCEEAIESFDCIALDSIWVEELLDLLTTFSVVSTRQLSILIYTVNRAGHGLMSLMK